MLSHEAYIGLGSNLGDRSQHLVKAIELLSKTDDIQIIKKSSIYETDPVGFTDQNCFLNMVVACLTNLSPHSLLKRLLEIEQALHRRRTIRWGPRTIDLDLLLYDNLHLADDQLEIPHPRMWDRPFVLIPLAEIKPDLIVPNGISLSKYVKQWPLEEGVRRWQSIQ